MQTTLTIVQLIDLFLSEHDVMEKSKVLYKNNLNLFFRWCAMVGIDQRNVSRENLLRYKANLQESKMSTLTINSRITTLRLFFDWLEICRYNSTNPAVGIKNIRTSRKYRKDSLTIDQVSQLLSVIDKTTTVGLRNFAIASLMLGNGLREIEVSRLDVCDVREQDGIFVISIWRKGHSEKDVTVRLSDIALDAISEYLACRSNVASDAPLFVIYSANGKGTRMTSKAISNMIDALLIKASLKSKRISPHSLRHTAGTLLLEGGASIYDVQLLLGHSTPATTEIYVSQIEAKRRLQNSPVVQLDAILKRSKANTLKHGEKQQEHQGKGF